MANKNLMFAGFREVGSWRVNAGSKHPVLRLELLPSTLRALTLTLYGTFSIILRCFRSELFCSSRGFVGLYGRILCALCCWYVRLLVLSKNANPSLFNLLASLMATALGCEGYSAWFRGLTSVSNVILPSLYARIPASIVKLWLWLLYFCHLCKCRGSLSRFW